MIGWISGRIVAKRPPLLVVDVNGLGYEVQAPMSTFSALPDTEQQVSLYTHHIVREDAQYLYGFHTLQDRDVFRELIKVSGIGGKIALAILSGLDASGLAHCVQSEDAISLSRLPGIGKKTADRLIIELRDKLGGYATTQSDAGIVSGHSTRVDDPSKDAVHALIALGLKPVEASKRVEKIDCAEKSVEEIVREALKAMAR